MQVVLELWQPGRVAYVFLLVYAIANAIVALLIYKKTGKDFLSVYAFGILAFIEIVLLSSKTTSVNGSFNFWQIPLAIAIVATVISIIYCSKNISKLRAKGKGQAVGIVIVTLIVSFLIPWATIDSANIFLDSSEPSYIEVAVVDKDIDSGARRITDYEIIVNIDGKEKTVSVSKSNYYDIEKGDTVVLSIYDGAFGVSYYQYEKSAQTQRSGL